MTLPAPLLLLVAGARGAVGSTLAAAVAALKLRPEQVLPYLTVPELLSAPNLLADVHFAGWDVTTESVHEAVQKQAVLPTAAIAPLMESLSAMTLCPAPDADSLRANVDALCADIRRFSADCPGARMVLVNLLPACRTNDNLQSASLEELYDLADPRQCPDLAYVLAALEMSLPVVNFSPNDIELPAICDAATRLGVPLCGRDGKTGQTYFKVVLASALRARKLRVDGWYSLNILGNDDGHNLMDPERAAGKMANKTDLLDDLLGYRVGQRHGQPSHQVRIDYYPPRGDAKEAWDVIDFAGLFEQPMSLRVDMQGRDSILAAPLALDMACWAAAMQMAGMGGLAPDLGFYFKRPLGAHPPVTFSEQLQRLTQLAKRIRDRLAES